MDIEHRRRWDQGDARRRSLRALLVRKTRLAMRLLRGSRGRLLDLGCGGGWGYLATRGPVIGVDLSWPGLANAQRIYGAAVQADLRALPFVDACMDVIVSLDVLGHIPPQDKDRVLAEVVRVLRPGGLTLHYVETAGDDPLSRFARRHPDLYQRHIVAPEGHVGLEPVGRTLQRFGAAGLRPMREAALYKGLLYPSRVVQLYHNDYRRHSRAVRWLTALCALLCRWRWLEHASNLGAAVLIEIGDALLPDRWAGGVLGCYRKDDPLQPKGG